jgi:Tetracyclin repressor-like, C-terminal domain
MPPIHQIEAYEPIRSRPGPGLKTSWVLVLAVWDVTGIRTAFLGLLRSAATTEQGVAMLREFVTSTILASLTQVAGLGDDADGRFRAALVASQVAGLGFARYVLGLEPLASAATEDLVARSARPCSAT